MRTISSAVECLAVVLLFAVACADNSADTTAVESAARPKKDAGADAAPLPDVPAPGTAGWVSCYTTGNPEAACDLSVPPGYCCFSNNYGPGLGSCIETTCATSKLSCDGDNDCAAGTKCWAYLQAVNHVEGACMISPPENPPAGPWHLCYPDDGSCDAGQTCVQARSVGINEFSPMIYVCQ